MLYPSLHIYITHIYVIYVEDPHTCPFHSYQNLLLRCIFTTSFSTVVDQCWAQLTASGSSLQVTRSWPHNHQPIQHCCWPVLSKTDCFWGFSCWRLPADLSIPAALQSCHSNPWHLVPKCLPIYCEAASVDVRGSYGVVSCPHHLHKSDPKTCSPSKRAVTLKSVLLTCLFYWLSVLAAHSILPLQAV